MKNLKHLVGRRMDVILEHDRRGGHVNYQHVTSHIVKEISCNDNVLVVVALDGRKEVFSGVKDIDVKRGLIVVQYKDNSRTFLDFF